MDLVGGLVFLAPRLDPALRLEDGTRLGCVIGDLAAAAAFAEATGGVVAPCLGSGSPLDGILG